MTSSGEVDITKLLSLLCRCNKALIWLPFSCYLVARRMAKVECNPLQQSMIDFLQDLHVSLQVEPELFDDPAVAQHPIELNLAVAFPLTKPRGLGILRFSNGMKNQASALVWQIVIRSVDEQVSKDEQELSIWLKDAHDMAEKWFFTLIRGKLLKMFGGET
jgi:uncharacterized protein (TIGR04255 family)